MRAGKRLANQLTEIAVHFKRTPQALFARSPKDVHHNVITMRIQPNEGIALSFGAKQPGSQMRAIRVDMDFSYRDAFGAETPAAYETLLLDAMRGDPTLFTRRDEVEAEWRIITPIEEAWAELPPPQFPNYPAGTEGPEASDHLIKHGNLQLASAQARGRRERLMTGANPRIAMVVSDVDGTLLDPCKNLTPGAPAAVQQLKQAGIRFTIVSARPPRLTRQLLRDLAHRRAVRLLQRRAAHRSRTKCPASVAHDAGRRPNCR